MAAPILPAVKWIVINVALPIIISIINKPKSPQK